MNHKHQIVTFNRKEDNKFQHGRDLKHRSTDPRLLIGFDHVISTHHHFAKFGVDLLRVASQIAAMSHSNVDMTDIVSVSEGGFSVALDRSVASRIAQTSCVVLAAPREHSLLQYSAGRVTVVPPSVYENDRVVLKSQLVNLICSLGGPSTVTLFFYDEASGYDIAFIMNDIADPGFLSHFATTDTVMKAIDKI